MFERGGHIVLDLHLYIPLRQRVYVLKLLFVNFVFIDSYKLLLYVLCDCVITR